MPGEDTASTKLNTNGPLLGPARALQRGLLQCSGQHWSGKAQTTTKHNTRSNRDNRTIAVATTNRNHHHIISQKATNLFASLLVPLLTLAATCSNLDPAMLTLPLVDKQRPIQGGVSTLFDLPQTYPE